MQALQHHLADTLKRERSQRGWSLTQAADATGVSKAMLGQIERGESSPTIATLWKIATGFNLSFSAFISAEAAPPDPANTALSAAQQAAAAQQTEGDPDPRPPHSGEGDQVSRPSRQNRASAAAPVEHPQRSHPTPVAYQQSDRGMQATLLFPFDPETGFELLVIELAAGALSESSAHEAGMIEHVIVLEGELEICLDGEWQRLACGEGVRFRADRPHAYRNPGAQPVRFHDVIHYPRR
ncbi:helix-turn-helix domain-containing protein [Erwinia sp. Leaf53]|uniref:helix-turn-helix domain-containing protein n=1 Tax=Erwinia sp. Leaf53 TaxID=1736225 RepID=UPI0007023115|nr:hypothetical protein ASF13_05700 [Erwinia sp. Leaf53]